MPALVPTKIGDRPKYEDETERARRYVALGLVAAQRKEHRRKKRR